MWHPRGHGVPTQLSVDVPWALRGVTRPLTLSSQPETRPNCHTLLPPLLLLLLPLSPEIRLCFTFCFTTETQVRAESPQEKVP